MYCRVASITKNSNILDIQEEALKKYASTHNYEITEIIRENRSGADLNRLGINKIYETIDKYDVDIIIAKNISRFGRHSPIELLYFVESLEKKGVQVITINEVILTSIPLNRL